MEDYGNRLSQAVLTLIEEKYRGRNLPVWLKPYEQVDLAPRVKLIAILVVRTVREQKDIYPVDPALLMGQIMAESFFSEFALSYAFALGVCQIIPTTAREYGLICAGDLPEHSDPPYLAVEDRGQLKESEILLAERNKLVALNPFLKLNYRTQLMIALQALAENKPLSAARAQLDLLNEIDRIDGEIREARQSFKNYLMSNFNGRNIFAPDDLAVLVAFDQRLSFEKSITVMVQMMAKALRARNGNVLAAIAAYHAGLSTTMDDGMYAPYGRLPNINSTAGYVSRVLINGHEIWQRMG